MNESTLGEYLQRKKPARVKLHLGCGGMRWLDFINVDLNPADPATLDRSRDGCVADVLADMTALGLSDDSIDEIFTAHTIDCFTRRAAIDMLMD